MDNKGVYLITNDVNTDGYVCYQLDVKSSVPGAVKEFYSTVFNSTNNKYHSKVKLNSGVTPTELIKKYNEELSSGLIYLGEILKLYNESLKSHEYNLERIKSEPIITGPMNGFLNMFNLKKKVMPWDDVHRFILSKTGFDVSKSINAIDNICKNTAILGLFDPQLNIRSESHKGYPKLKQKRNFTPRNESK